MMISPLPVVFLTIVFLARMAQANYQNAVSHQGEIFVSAHEGDSVTLQCLLNDKVATMYWYKQCLGQKPQLISTLRVSDKKESFHKGFENNPRFTLDTGTGRNHLNITRLSSSDSAFYYCIRFTTYDVKPISLFFVSVKNSFLFHQSLSTDQSGNSVTPNCIVDIGSCGEEHSVYWFRDSGGSHPGLIYTQGGSNDQCERINNTQTHTCVYNLPMKSLNLSHTGTYYCAVAACGHILFGNVNKLDIESKEVFLVYLLSGALACTSILVVFQSVLLYRNRRQSKESDKSGLTRSSIETPQGNQEADDIHYAALNVSLPNRTRRQRNSTNTKNECVYASVKQN
ncbi:uncharacterized protein LOC142893448 [Nelusetta ayraudi]|uniref:uncharacterized protein LOC142893448 n=1 Tax=Nelusetta ayraudi TaxID=303726 RepID=UPI003F6F9E7C